MNEIESQPVSGSAAILRRLVERWQSRFKTGLLLLPLLGLPMLVILETPQVFAAGVARGGRINPTDLVAAAVDPGTALTVVGSALGALVALTIPLILNEGRSQASAEVQVQRGQWMGVAAACVSMLAGVSVAVASSAVLHNPTEPLSLLSAGVAAITVVLAAATLADTQIDQAVTEAARVVERESVIRARKRVLARMERAKYVVGEPKRHIVWRWPGLLVTPLLTAAVGALGAIQLSWWNAEHPDDVHQLLMYVPPLSVVFWLLWLPVHVTSSLLSWWSTSRGWGRVAWLFRFLPPAVLAWFGFTLWPDSPDGPVSAVLGSMLVLLAVVGLPDQWPLNPSIVVAATFLRSLELRDDNDLAVPDEVGDQDAEPAEGRSRPLSWLAPAACATAVAAGVIILTHRRRS